MPFDDLDLEFEDEEEVKKKKTEAVQVDVDLEFHTADSSQKARPARPLAPAAAPAATAPEGEVGEATAITPLAEVKKIDEARKETQIKKPVLATAPGPRVQGSSALKESPQTDFEGMEVVALREHVRQVEFDSQVKVAIAEYKTELIGELLGDMKLMEHQVQQLLVRINAKHPDMKQEVLMIKKILADFTAKKRK